MHQKTKGKNKKLRWIYLKKTNHVQTIQKAHNRATAGKKSFGINGYANIKYRI